MFGSDASVEINDQSIEATACGIVISNGRLQLLFETADIGTFLRNH